MQYLECFGVSQDDSICCEGKAKNSPITIINWEIMAIQSTNKFSFFFFYQAIMPCKWS